MAEKIMIKKIHLAIIILAVPLLAGSVIALLFMQAPQECTVAFRDGGGPYYLQGAPFREFLAPQDSKGREIVIKGRVLASDCKTPLAGSVIDIWHADDKGFYNETWYRGRITADSKGEYSFSTIQPLGYGEGTAFRPPHIHYKIFLADQEIITSQMFFPDTRGQIDDAYIIDFIDEQTAVFDIVTPRLAE